MRYINPRFNYLPQNCGAQGSCFLRLLASLPAYKHAVPIMC